MFDHLVTPKQYADFHGYSPNTVNTWVKRRQISTVAVAGRTFLSLKAQPDHNKRAVSLKAGRSHV